MNEPVAPREIDFRELAEQAGDPIVVQDGERIAWANAAAAALVGASHPRDVIGHSVLEYVPHEFQALVVATMTTVMTSGAPAPPTEQALLRLDGSRVEVEIFGSRLGPGRILLVIRDISGRRRAEAAQHVAEVRLRAFFDLSTEAMGLASAGRYLLVNPAFASLFQYAPEEIHGLPLLELFAPSERSRILDFARQRATGEAVPDSYFSRGLRRDGSEFEAELRVFGIRDGGTLLTAAVVRDVTEQRRAERRLSESERRYRELFDLVPVCLWEEDASGVREAVDRLVASGVTDLRAHFEAHPEAVAECAAALRILDVNQTTLRTLGAATREELTANLGRVFTEESLPISREAILQLASTGRGVRTEGAIGTLSGDRRWVEMTAILRPGSERSWDRIIVATADVTEKRRAEQERAALQDRLRTFFDTSGDAIGLASEGRYVYVNRALARLFGYGSPEELAGKPVEEVVAPSERERVGRIIRHRTAGGEAPTEYVTRGLRRDGSEFELEVRASTFHDGNASLAMAILRDVTEARRLERDLRESERRYRELFDLVPVSLFEIDATEIRASLDQLAAMGVGDLRAYTDRHPELVAERMRTFRVIAVNAAGLALVGARSLDELLANRERIYPPESHARYREMALQLAEGRTTAHFEGWIGTVAGGRRWIETVATLIPGHEGSWARLIFASIDVTDRRRAEEERASLQERLRQSEKLEAVGRLAGGVAHDFNNILSGILGYAELSSLELTPGSDLHEHQLRIREAALRARDLVRQILTFSRRDRANRRPVDVPMLVREALGLMRTGIPATATLDVRIDPAAGATLADPTQLHQIVLNLCANARDAIGTYGRIEVSADPVELDGTVGGLPAGRYVRLRVRDDGVGIDDATRARLFEPFMTTKGPFGGHGLGLAVVHGIVGSVGGAILVESVPGKGATFDVYLQRVELEPPEVRPPPPRATGRGERILVVDDEAMVRNTQKRILEGLGYAVEVAADGQEALERYRAAPHAFDLVLTDQTMPRLSGIDLARAILAIRADARVILCTGYSDKVDDELAQKLGLCALLAKPFDREGLSSAIQRALGRA